MPINNVTSSLLRIKPEERTAIYIDGPNFYSSLRELNFIVDYETFRKVYEDNCRLVTLNYYTAEKIDAEGFAKIRPILDFMSYNGYNVITRDVKEYSDPVTGRVRTKGNLDVDMAVDMIDASYEAHIDHFVLYSGDGDFIPVLNSVRRRGARTTVVSTRNAAIPMLSDSLVKTATNFIELDNLKCLFERRRPNAA